ncbi:MAG: phosphatase PAP2 family protein [Bacteroidia bacterium]
MKTISTKDIILVSAISLAYLLLCTWLLGFKSDQVVLVTVFNGLFYASAITRKFILGFLSFIIFWVIFDFMKVFPNYNFNAIHIQDLYLREKFLFGINDADTILTPNEYALKYSKPALDAIAGFFYLNWIPMPMLFAAYLFTKDKTQFLHFVLSFLFVNFIGFTIYYSYPAAPPWYVQKYGFEVNYHSGSSAAGLLRFDQYFGVNIFGSLYQKSSNVFAAMPSLHSAYPLIVFYYGVKNKLGFINIYFGAVMLGIWFAAVYSSHHYIQDVLAGITCAIMGLFIFQKVLFKTRWFTKFLNAYKKLIT